MSSVFPDWRKKEKNAHETNTKGDAMSERAEYPSSEASYRSYYKLFVGCISYDAIEEDLLPIFSSFGDIVEFTIQRDREGRSRGCAWLKYTTQDACENCIATLSNNYYVNGMKSPIVVKYANTQDDDVCNSSTVGTSVTKLFVGGYPISATDDEIYASLSMFGSISDFNRLTRMGVATGPVFVSYSDRTSANALLNANGATIFMTTADGSSEIPVILRVSGAFSPVVSVPAVGAGGSVTSRTSSDSPVNSHPRLSYAAAAAMTCATESVSPSHAPGAGRQSTTTNGNGGGKLFVGCLPYSRTSNDLAELFSQYGPLVEVALLTTPDGKSKGAAFVTFVERLDAEKALAELQGYTFPNSSRGINISFATKQTRPGGSPLVPQPAPSSTGLNRSTSTTTFTSNSPSAGVSRYHTVSPPPPSQMMSSVPNHIPQTPPGFTDKSLNSLVSGHPLLTPFSYSPPAGPVDTPIGGTDEILRYIQSRHSSPAPVIETASSYSILRKTSDISGPVQPDLEHINEAMLKSLFGSNGAN
jgi:RNA recognition motif-containing protein